MNDRDIQKACTSVGLILKDLLDSEERGNERVAASMAVSMAGLIVTASTVMDGFNPDRNKLPTEDHMLFAALLVWTSCHLEGAHLAVTTSPEMIRETMDQFEKFTGQSARPLLNKGLMAVVDEVTKVDRSSFGENSKFLPH